ncbi:MAG: hypothetical protein GX437_05695 [Sphingobacteriales bacterium]|nr:hypothetical protein [Sphingobacteriales bacterium]
MNFAYRKNPAYSMRLFVLILLLFLFSCKNTNNNRPDLTELNESLGYQTAADVNEKSIVKEPYPDPDVFDYFVIDLDGDKENDSIFLKEKAKNNEPGVFHRMDIKFSSGSKFKHGNPIAFDKYDSLFNKIGKNELNSEYVFLVTFHGVKYILMSCYKADCCAKNQSIIKIRDNKAILVFNKGFDLSFIGDTDNDGVIEITGKSSSPQIFESLPDLNADVGTYVPYEVYLIKDIPEYSTEKSRVYNEKYYVWAGEKPSPFIKVLYPNDAGKPSLYQK